MSPPATRIRGATLATLALLGAACAAAPAAAIASTQASLHVSFSPDRLGADTAVTVAMRFAGGPEGVPPPLRTMTIRMPAGLVVSLRGAATCSRARLRSSGAAGCPAGSLLGRGHAQLEVHAGSQTIPEQAKLWAFRGRSAGAQSIEILGAGSTPLDERTLSTGVLHRDAAPFGSRLAVTIPRIPTLELEPDASFDSLSLTLGSLERRARAHVAGAHIRVPRRCPVGGFPFAAAFTFADGSRANAAAVVACP